MTSKIRSAFWHALGLAGLRSDDLLLASFPKSGNTWVRYFFCNLISQQHWGGQRVDFKALDETMPELGVDNLLRRWPYGPMPRMVKTHRGYLPFFANKKTILLVRDPRDVMVSYFHFLTDQRSGGFEGSFQDFIRHGRLGLRAWFEHFRSWQGRCSLQVRYEDLKKDDLGHFREIVSAIGLALDEEALVNAVLASRFKRMQATERKYGHAKPEFFKEGRYFLRRGETQQWVEMFEEKDRCLYQELQSRFQFSLYE